MPKEKELITNLAQALYTRLALQEEIIKTIQTPKAEQGDHKSKLLEVMRLTGRTEQLSNEIAETWTDLNELLPPWNRLIKQDPKMGETISELKKLKDMAGEWDGETLIAQVHKQIHQTDEDSKIIARLEAYDQETMSTARQINRMRKIASKNFENPRWREELGITEWRLQEYLKKVADLQAEFETQVGNHHSNALREKFEEFLTNSNETSKILQDGMEYIYNKRDQSYKKQDHKERIRWMALGALGTIIAGVLFQCLLHL